MSTRSEEFAGLSVAMITPFHDGQVDFDALQRQVEFQIHAGTRCVCPVGTTGECPTLSYAEHERVISAVVEAAAGRIKVMAGTGSNSTDEALELTRWAAKAKADAALVVTPYYNKPTQEGIYQHFKVLAQAVDIPLCIYNIPGRTGRNIEPETIVRMAELPNVTMVKESTGSLDQASQIINATDLTVLSGDDSLTLPLLAVGARGVVSVVGNIVPQDVIAMLRAFESDDLAEARRWHHKLFPLCRDMLGLSTNPIPIKAAMRMLGRDTGDLRMPLVPLSPAEEAKLRATLVAYGLLKKLWPTNRLRFRSDRADSVSMREIFLLCEYPTLNGGERSMLATLDGVRAAGFRGGHGAAGGTAGRRVGGARRRIGPVSVFAGRPRPCRTTRRLPCQSRLREEWPRCSGGGVPPCCTPTAW